MIKTTLTIIPFGATPPSVLQVGVFCASGCNNISVLLEKLFQEAEAAGCTHFAFLDIPSLSKMAGERVVLSGVGYKPPRTPSAPESTWGSS